MSRSNNPGSGAGGPPQRPHAPEVDPHGWPTNQPPPAPQGWPPQPQAGQGYPQAQPIAYQAPQGHDPYAASGYHYPQGQPQADAYAGQPPMRPGYAPQFERFAQPQAPQAAQRAAPAPRAPEAPRGYQPVPQPAFPQNFQPQEPAYAPPPDPRTAPPTGGQRAAAPPRPQPPQQQTMAPRPPMPPPAQAPDLRGTLTDQWPTTQSPRAPQHAHQGQPQADPRGYDLGAYGAQPSAAGRAEWQHQPHLQTQSPRTAPPQPTLDPAAFSNPQMAAGPKADQSRAVVAEQDYAHDDVEYDDEPPRRSRGLLIVGALVGAIALGGGLAYAYKSFLAPPQASKATPRVAAPRDSGRTTPADPGGRQIAGQGTKVMGDRLTGGGDSSGSGQTASNAAVGDDGVRRVPTVAIRPDGSMAAPAPQAPPGVGPASNAPPGVFVVGDPMRRTPPPPGMAGVGGPIVPPQAAPSLPPPRAAAEPRTITLPPPREEPAVAAPAPKAPRVAVAPPPPPPAPQAEAAPVPKKPLPRPTAPVAAPASGGSGYVAVLASQRSQMDALRTFADLQQKYGVLQGRTPDVREVNLGEKGIYHRLMVGPSGPKEQASALCNELKTAGYSGCWVTSQ